MRPLVADASRLEGPVFRRLVRRAQFGALFAEAYAFGEPYVSLNGLVLERQELATLERLAPLFASVFYKAGLAVREQPELLVDMGFPWAMALILAAEPPSVPLIGRFDFVKDTAGRFWVLEYNADTPSGVREATGVEPLVAELLPEARAVERVNARLLPQLVPALVGRVDAASGVLGLVTHAGHLEDMANMFYWERLVGPVLAERGVDVVTGDAYNLQATPDALYLCGRRVGTLFRYLAMEQLFGRRPFFAIVDAAMHERVAVVNGLFGLLLQNKGLMAWIWAHRADTCFTVEEQAAIAEHMPATDYVDSYDDAVAPRGRVLKSALGREGAEVQFTDELSLPSWQLAQRGGQCVVQHRVDVAPVTLSLHRSDHLAAVEGFPTVGAFVVEQDFAGLFTRFGGRITKSTASWVPTFAELA